jgi:hypothetical protein
MTWRDGGREARSDPDDAGEGPNRGEIAVYFPFVGEGALARARRRRRPDLICVRACVVSPPPAVPRGQIRLSSARGQASGWDGTGALGLA